MHELKPFLAYGKKIEETNVHVNIEEKEFPNQNHDIKIDIDNFVSPDTENDELKEMNDINFNIDTLEPMKLKKPNEFYYEIYKKAKEKAKQAKKEMLIAYLEAKNIKKTYMLDDLEDDDGYPTHVVTDNNIEYFIDYIRSKIYYIVDKTVKKRIITYLYKLIPNVDIDNIIDPALTSMRYALGTGDMQEQLEILLQLEKDINLFVNHKLRLFNI